MKSTKIEKIITRTGIISLAGLAIIGILASFWGAWEIDLDFFTSTPLENLFYFVLFTLSILVTFCLPASFLMNVASIASSLRASNKKTEITDEENL